MKRLAIIMTITSLVVLAIGIIDWATNYNWAQGDQNALAGNQNILLNDGMTLMIAAGFLLIGSAIMWILALRQGHGDQRES